MHLGITLLVILAAAFLLWGQRKHWGLAPVGLLGLVFIVPMFMLLTGIL